MITKTSTYTFTCDWPLAVCTARLVIHGEHKKDMALQRARRAGWSSKEHLSARCPEHAYEPSAPVGWPGHQRKLSNAGD
jgi:hypothetical protein